ncbi:MAG: hypothetical protein HYZ36_00880, partial [Pedosphaera parvula]|nr:hypothetical protein [Pedosphaera parvula]
MSLTQASITLAGIPLRTVLGKTITLVLIGVAFGWIYAWASPRVFPRQVQAGAGYGVAHGALMPMA